MSEKPVCIFCGNSTDDWWMIDKKNNTCRCRECYDKGIAETEQEKIKHTNYPYMPVKNRNYFKPEFLNEKKSQIADEENLLHIVRFAPQGSLVEFSPRSTEKKIYNRSPRGEITAFSVRSRSRLNKKIAMLKRDILPLFVTLTYHNDISETFEGYKYHLDLFVKWLFRRFPGAGVIWKLEFQKRGYAHYHLFVWGVSLEDLQAFVPETWHEIAGNHSTYHLAWHKGELGGNNEHCVQPIRSWNGVRSYASKYFAKLDDTKNRGGRVWGIRGSVPFSKILEFRVNLQVALELRQSLIFERNYEFQRLGFWTFDYSPALLSFFDSLINAWEVLQRPPDDPPDWELYFEQ
jgi:hypothetical protein